MPHANVAYIDELVRATAVYVSPTLTLHVADAPLAVVAVITAVPFFTAVTVPPETVATPVLLELHVALLLPLVTVTEHVALAPDAVVAVIVAEPAAFAVIVPLLTVATLELLVLQVTEALLDTEAEMVFVGEEYPLTETLSVPVLL